MKTILSQHDGARLERLCGHSRPGGAAWIRIGSGSEGIERLEAHFRGQAFSPHRHDTYAIGITVTGVQSFHYRGEQFHCLPGQCHILHPDEAHDGAARADGGFGYRIICVDPCLIKQALGGGTLPFVRSPVVDASRLPEGFSPEIWDIDAELDDMWRVEVVVALSNLLAAASSRVVARSVSCDVTRMSRVRDLIASSPDRQHSMAELERVADLDRWAIARQFRAAFGTSPSRFRTLRQLDRVRRLVMQGGSLAEASAVAGFADQSHMSRRFKSAYGLTPGGWAAAIGLTTESQPRARRVVR
jgi:AraC-like DNA-binding protein